MMTAAVLCTSCIGRVKKAIDVATNYNFGNEELESSANALGCSTAMVVARADTSSVLYFNAKSKHVFTMTYVSYDGGYHGRGGQYRLDTVNAYNPSYERHGDTAATLVIGDPESVLELEGIERWDDSLRFRVPIEGEEPFCVRLKLYDKHLEGCDPLADADVQRMLVLGLTLHYTLEEIEADRQKSDRDMEEMENAFAMTDSTWAQTGSADDEWQALVEAGNSLGFHDQRIYQTPGKTTIALRGDHCKADQCHDRMLRLSELAGKAGMAYAIKHRPKHNKCLFKAEIKD